MNFSNKHHSKKLSISKVFITTCSLLSLASVHLPVNAEPVNTVFEKNQKKAFVSLYTLQNGVPKGGVVVYSGDKKIGQTDADGFLSLKLLPGKQTLILKSQNQLLTELKLNIASGDDVELIVPITQKAKVKKVLDESAKLDSVIVKDDVNQKESNAEDLDVVEVEGIKVITSKISGSIFSFMTGEPVPEANIYLTGVQQSIKTDENGYFEVEVPIGSYSLSVIHPDYSSSTIKGLVLNKGEELNQELELTPAATELEEFIVTAPSLEGGILAVLAEKQNSSGVAEVVSAEEFSKSGDSNAASALSRVTGLTLVDGKYIYVRGMGDRYSSTRLNGAGLPSPEPTKRVVPLDMFPTGMIGSILVQKTYSPNLPGAFGGGTVLLRTKPIPLEKSRKVSINLGGNSQSSFKSLDNYQGGSRDWLGIDDGTRDIPSGAENFVKNPPERFDPLRDEDSELYDIAKQMPNIYKLSPSYVGPDIGIKLGLGDRYEAYGGNSGWGYNFALNYSNKSRYSEEERQDFAEPTQRFLPELERKYKTSYSTNLGMMGSLIYEEGENTKLDATTIIARNSSDTIIRDTSYSSDNENNFEKYSLQWEERQLLSQQFHGLHIFPNANDLELEWQTTLSNASRVSPDTRVYAYQQSANVNDDTGELNPYQFQFRGDGNQRMWEELDDQAMSSTLDFKLPIYDWWGMSGLIKSGLMVEQKDRTSDTYKFSWDTTRFRNVDGATEALESGNPEDIFVNENLGTERNDVKIKNITQSTDSYKASEKIEAFYLMSDFQISKYLKVMAGLRSESSLQEVEVFTDAQRTEVDKTSLDERFWLPALSFTVPYRKGEQLRLAYSKTLNRPDLKELSESTYIDPESRDYYTGNPDLKIATIKNIDIRWEKYFNKFENISFALFKKDFTNPIEIIETPNVTEGLKTYTYSNVSTATNQGVELQTRLWLRRFFGRDFPAFYLEGNFTKIDSSVDFSGLDSIIATNSERPLQGQSPWVFNLNLGYENLIKEINANLVLNMKGDSIYAAGSKISPDAETGVDDTYLVSPATLDFVYNQRVYWGAEDKLKLKFKAQNLLDGIYKLRIQDEIQKQYKKGISFNLSLEYTWK